MTIEGVEQWILNIKIQMLNFLPRWSDSLALRLFVYELYVAIFGNNIKQNEKAHHDCVGMMKQKANELCKGNDGEGKEQQFHLEGSFTFPQH